MVSRNRIGRQDIEAWDTDREDDSPWSEDQATTCYMPEDFNGMPGVVYGLPPLPRRFQDGSEDSREIARVSAEPEPAVADGGNSEWLDLQTSWDISPPRASGVARRASPRTAAETPNSRMDRGFEAARLDSSSSDWAAEFEAQLEAARSEHGAWWGTPDAASTQGAGHRSAPSRSGAYAPSTAHDAWHAESASADAAAYEEAPQYAREQPPPAIPELPADDQNPWQDEPYVHSLTPSHRDTYESASPWRHADYAPTSRSHERRPAAQPAAPASGRAPAARTQRQRPQRANQTGAQQARSGTTGQFSAAAPTPPAIFSTPMPPRAAQWTRPLSRSAAASRTVRARPLPAPPAPPSYAFDDDASNPFAPRRRTGKSKLFVPFLMCAAASALYFGGQLPRIAGWLQPEPAPVLRSVALPELTPRAPAAPPPAAEPAAAAPSDVAYAAAAPLTNTRRSSSARTRKSDTPSYASQDDDSTSTRRRTPARAAHDDLDSEPQAEPTPSRRSSSRLD